MADERERLKAIWRQSPRLQKAYGYKKIFRNVYETSLSVSDGQKRIERWLQKARTVYGQVINTISKHLSGICNYFISRATSGVMEGIKNKIKLLMRQGYGFKNFQNFCERLLACW